MQKKYIQTREICDKYGVSNVTVAKWLLMTSKGETGLKFENVGKRIRILDTDENWLILDQLGKKATSKRQQIFSTNATVNPDFYNYFSRDELTEIARDLEFRRYINFKFTHKGEGAYYWDQFYQENEENGEYKTPRRTKEILDYYAPILIDKMQQFDRVNVVEIGPGNALPVVNFLGKIQKGINISKYIGVDLSPELLELAISNLSSNLKGLEYIKLIKDVERDRVDSAFSYSYADNKRVANIVLLVGSTILNTYETKSILQSIRRSLSPDDILLFNTNVDDPSNNLNFGYFHSPESMVQDTWIPKSLGIDVDKCQLISEFDKQNNQKIEYLILDKDYNIKFDFKGFYREVTLKKKDRLLLWTYSITDVNSCIDLFSSSGFQLIDAITLPNKKHFMISVRVGE